ncbi:MAG: transporter, partial [Thermoguttaceae bacterium]
AHDLPELLVRYGLAERLELRVAWDEGMVFESRRDRNTGRIVTESGSTDMDIGFKYALTQQDKWRPQSAIITAVSAPVGTPELSSEQVDVLINYLYSWEFTEKLSLNCSTGSLWTAESGDHFSQFFQSASVEYELTKKLHVFNEWAVFLRRDYSDNRPQFYYDAGLTYLVTPNFQLDWSAGVGLNHAADGFFTGCGLTIRK